MKRNKFIKLTGAASLGFIIGCKNDSVPFSKGDRIAFIGDSITQQGKYITYLQDWLDADLSSQGLKLINLGLSSETVSGLSEPIHVPKRPVLFDRLEGILKKNKPDWSFFCYGINDGIYHPYSTQNFESYKKGVRHFLDIMNSKKINCILLTPTPFIPSKLKVNPDSENNEEGYSWKNPFPNYNEDVLKKYQQFILSLEHPILHQTINIFAPLLSQSKKAYDNDPIHPNEEGHRIIAKTIQKSLT